MLTAEHIYSTFEPLRNRENAEKMEKYMRNLFPFLGVKTPERKQAYRSVLKEYGAPAKEEIIPIVKELWHAEEREYQYVAQELLARKKQLEVDDDELIEFLVTTKSWWDTVDGLASNTAGTYFMQYPKRTEELTGKWIHHENMWLNRTAILFQLKYKEKTDFELLKDYCLIHAESKEFFLQKAIGWALREYSKTDPDAVEQFIEQHQLAPLSKREGLKVVKKQATNNR
ncbi:DNA alkylation repair protein [Alkalihalobacillus sp. CinArs1]|uniref:DNA alkylation repair protein n=1 Tax=Alkalihalobacillus sp. CinArs1 TaxID=2995314 RepID=UPI0022DD8FC3|nr:DNA alkylation repair protein [Alkalihalobacillus sp. CinArs1]